MLPSVSAYFTKGSIICGTERERHERKAHIVKEVMCIDKKEGYVHPYG